MEQLQIKRNYPKNFLHNYIPKYIKYYCHSKQSKEEEIKVNNYLISTYNISFKDLVEYFISNIKFSYNNDSIIIFINNNKKINNVKLITIIDSINFGNLNFKGNNLFNNAFDYINKNIDTLYFMYQMRGK